LHRKIKVYPVGT